MYPEKGLAALAATLSLPPASWRPQRVASPFDWPKLMAGATHIFPLFSEHAGFAAPAQPAAAAASTAAAFSKARRAGRGRTRALQPRRPPAAAAKADAATVQAAVAEVVAGMLGAAVDPAQPLMEAGLDSLGGHCIAETPSMHMHGLLHWSAAL